jgi:hypothetical protein
VQVSVVGQPTSTVGAFCDSLQCCCVRVTNLYVEESSLCISVVLVLLLLRLGLGRLGGAIERLLRVEHTLARRTNRQQMSHRQLQGGTRDGWPSSTEQY